MFPLFPVGCVCREISPSLSLDGISIKHPGAWEGLYLLMLIHSTLQLHSQINTETLGSLLTAAQTPL